MNDEELKALQERLSRNGLVDHNFGNADVPVNRMLVGRGDGAEQRARIEELLAAQRQQGINNQKTARGFANSLNRERAVRGAGDFLFGLAGSRNRPNANRSQELDRMISQLSPQIFENERKLRDVEAIARLNAMNAFEEGRRLGDEQMLQTLADNTNQARSAIEAQEAKMRIEELKQQGAAMQRRVAEFEKAIAGGKVSGAQTEQLVGLYGDIIPEDKIRTLVGISNNQHVDRPRATSTSTKPDPQNKVNAAVFRLGEPFRRLSLQSSTVTGNDPDLNKFNDELTNAAETALENGLPVPPVVQLGIRISDGVQREYQPGTMEDVQLRVDQLLFNHELAHAQGRETRTFGEVIRGMDINALVPGGGTLAEKQRAIQAAVNESVAIYGAK